MASINIIGFSSLPKDADGKPLPLADLSADIVFQQTLTYAAAANSNPIPAKARFLYLQPDAAAHIHIDSTATASDFRLPANSGHYVAVTKKKADTFYLSAYDGVS